MQEYHLPRNRSILNMIIDLKYISVASTSVLRCWIQLSSLNGKYSNLMLLAITWLNTVNSPILLLSLKINHKTVPSIRPSWFKNSKRWQSRKNWNQKIHLTECFKSLQVEEKETTIHKEWWELTSWCRFLGSNLRIKSSTKSEIGPSDY